MTIGELDPHLIGWLALSTALAEVMALLFGLLSMPYGRVFGRIHDILTGLGAVLTAGVAMLIFPEHRQIDDQFAMIAFGLALVGAFLAGLGSVVATTEAVGWFLAQTYVAVGYALIGIWLLILNWEAMPAGILPNRAVNVGLFAGSVMILGLAAIPALMMRSEDESTAPWISRFVGRSGNLGWLILYPLWCVWMAASRI